MVTSSQYMVAFVVTILLTVVVALYFVCRSYQKENRKLREQIKKLDASNYVQYQRCPQCLEATGEDKC